MSNQIMTLIQSNASAAQIISNGDVADRFRKLYKTIHGIKDANRADAFYQAEKFHFLKLINDSANIQACSKLSLYGIFMDVAVSGLSFDPSMKHLYVVPFSTNIGTKDAPKWEKRASLMISGYGELLLRQLQGQVKYADNPVVVFEGDDFRFGTMDGKTVVEHMACIPRKSDNIIAAFIKITRYDDSIDYKVMAMEDIEKLRKFSKDPKSKAWTDGLKGMVEAKTIKHAFKNYPKVRVGDFSKLASETVDEEVVEDQVIDYGVSSQAPSHLEQMKADEEAFTPKTKPQPAGVTYYDDDF